MNARVFLFSLFYLLECLYYGFSAITERVINGYEADITSVSYIVSLKYNDDHKCGGSIYNKNWVITAAHCLVNIENPLESVTLCSGTSVYNKDCALHNVDIFKIHEEYNPKTYDYDIAIIRVTPAFTFSDNTTAVALPSNTDINKECGKACGWGYYEKEDDEVVEELSNHLQCTDLPYVSQEQCEIYYENKITPRMICYGFPQGGTDTCQGDSGGPLVNPDDNLIGITSWGNGCANENSPGVYTNVIYFEPWIVETIEMYDSLY